MKRLLAAFVLCLLPQVAFAGDGAKTLSDADAKAFAEASRQKQFDEQAVVAAMSDADVRAALTANVADKTKIFYQAGYGVFVEYSAADGSDRMWFPKNHAVVKGIWGIRVMDGKTKACFHYFNARNTVTGEFEGTECISPAQTLSGADVLEMRSGDVFGLMKDKLPYVKSAMDVPLWPGDGK
ncbi:hypothetical protein [Asticcacaulis solisilvae]|uniref:hypothetical protein n=1 Tax=Asticcacaulis solisilvae TaxID=1217274 RepID=UPI003FD86028